MVELSFECEVVVLEARQCFTSLFLMIHFFCYFLILAFKQILILEQCDFTGTDSDPCRQKSGIRLVPINSTSRCSPSIGLP